MKQGVEPALRKEVWKFLLGYLEYGATDAERQQTMASLRREYEELKAKWVEASSLTDEQDPTFQHYTQYSRKIAKDVHRTDQNEEYYSGKHNPRFTQMRELLLAYSFYDMELGYVQGMSDLLSPVLVVMDNEADAFWCFVGIMSSVVRCSFSFFSFHSSSLTFLLLLSVT